MLLEEIGVSEQIVPFTGRWLSHPRVVLLRGCCRARRSDLVELGHDAGLLGISDPPAGCSGCPLHECCGVEERFDNLQGGQIDKFVSEPRDQIDILIENLGSYIQIAERE